MDCIYRIKYYSFFLGVFLILFFPNTLISNTLADLLVFFDRDFRVKFEETLTNSDLNYKASSTGNLYFRKGGLLRFEYEQPDPQLVIVGKEKVWIYDELLNNVVIADLNTNVMLQDFIFLRWPEKLKQLFSVISKSSTQLIKPMVNQKMLFLKSVDPKHPLAEIHLAYDSTSKRIEQIGVVDRDSYFRILKFSDFEYPSDMEDSQFLFILPENVEVIEEK